MELEFLHPLAFLALLLLPALWLWPAGRRDARRALLRSLVVALVILALARPVTFTTSDAEHHVLLVDRSASSGDAAGAAAQRVARGLPRGARLSVVEVAPDGAAPLTFEEDVDVRRLASSGSPLGAALEVAARAIPAGARGALTLIGDGLATDTGWGDVTLELTTRGLPVHTYALDEQPGDLRPVGVRALDVARVGARTRIAVDVVGQAEDATLTLAGEDGELARAAFAVDGRARVVVAFEPATAGFAPLTVTVAGADERAGDEQLAFTLPVQDALRVLYLGARVQGGGARMSELLGPGFALDAGDARDESGLDAYDLAVLDDRPADQVPEAFQQALVSAVRERGLGLLMAGGSGSFGPGGYHETPIEALLPVEFVQKEEKRDPSTTLVVIIDTSGSMGGNRVQLAKEVTRLAIRRLLPHDKVGIVEFYGAKRWAAPIQPASNAIEIERALNRLDAGGGTVILPAIEEAFYGMLNVQTRFKHVLVLTDGGVETGAFEPLLRRMANKGINVSTVLIGPDAHSEFLVTLANWGKGRFYSVPDRFNLPEILLKQPASAKLPAWRPGAMGVRARGGRGWWGDIDPTSVPSLAGYVETRPRPGAERVLETAEGAHPVLASWRYGLGRVTALTTEPTGPGTAPWDAWDGYGAFLARVLRRTADDARAPFAFSVLRRGARVELHAERRAPTSGVPAADWLTAGGARPLTFEERAPGHFVARLLVDPAAEARLVARAAGDPNAPAMRLVCAPAVVPELNVDPAHALDLAALARATGGEHGPASAAGGAPRAGGGVDPPAVRKLWPLVLALALLAYLLDILDRRREPGRARSHPTS
jgi:hypothetical protein